MNILVLEPYFGGSHKALIDGWRDHTIHQFTVLELPAYKWKWRMRHAAVTFAQQLGQHPHDAQRFDAIWCSDMLNLAEFIGLAPPHIQQLPRVVYFHENQLTYPVLREEPRDLHFAYSHFTSTIAADQIWFNSEFHRREYFDATRAYLAKMPDYQAIDLLSELEGRSAVHYPGVSGSPPRTARRAGPMRICWNARWEHDKNPETFFAALRILNQQRVDFRLIVLGESFQSVPPIFDEARGEFARQIEHWGYAASTEEYRRLLNQADVIVSSADHEFFGIGIVEAIVAGAMPVLPNRLAYPEVMRQICGDGDDRDYLYDGSVAALARRLAFLAGALNESEWQQRQLQLQAGASCFLWPRVAKQMDNAMLALN